MAGRQNQQTRKKFLGRALNTAGKTTLSNKNACEPGQQLLISRCIQTQKKKHAA